MVIRAADARALRRADDDGAVRLALEHEVQLGGAVDDLVERYARKVRKHNLRDGAQTGDSRAVGKADNRGFRKRGVENPIRPAVVDVLCEPEVAAHAGNVLAEDEDGIVPLHLLNHGFVNGFRICQLAAHLDTSTGNPS